MPPKKAGPKSGRTFKICWLGITRYPASLIDVILLYKLTFDRYTCIVAIAWAVSIPRKSALAVQETLFVIKFFGIFAIYSNNMLFPKFSGNVTGLSKYYKCVTTHIVRLKLFRLNGSEENDCRTLAECDSCTKHGFKMRFFLTVFSLQPIHLSTYINVKLR